MSKASCRSGKETGREGVSTDRVKAMYNFLYDLFGKPFLIFAVILAVIDHRKGNIRVFPFDGFPVDNSETFSVSAERMIVPPAAGDAAGAGRGDIIGGKINTVLKVFAFLLQGAEFIDQHWDAV